MLQQFGIAGSGMHCWVSLGKGSMREVSPKRKGKPQTMAKSTTCPATLSTAWIEDTTGGVAASSLDRHSLAVRAITDAGCGEWHALLGVCRPHDPLAPSRGDAPLNKPSTFPAAAWLSATPVFTPCGT